MLFTVVKVLGAGYLGWLAVGMMRGALAMWRARRVRDEEAPAGAEPTGPAERPFRRALVVSLLNPKAILFLLSFFVQFVDPQYEYPALSFLLLGAVSQLVSFLYLSTLIFTGTRLSAAFRRRKRLAAGATSAAGVIFLGFAAKLAVG